MSSPVVTAGSRVFISGNVPLTNDISGFSVLPWTQIKGVRAAGELGNNWQTRDEALIDDTSTIFKRKTFLAQSPLTLEVITLIGDPGQAMLQASSGTTNDYSFKMVHANGNVRYFVGQVFDYRESQGGNGRQLHDSTCTVEPQQTVVFN